MMMIRLSRLEQQYHDTAFLYVEARDRHSHGLLDSETLAEIEADMEEALEAYLSALDAQIAERESDIDNENMYSW